MKLVRHAGIEAVQLWVPLFALELFAKLTPKNILRELIKASFGYAPLECRKYGRLMRHVEIGESNRGHLWMKRWRETHRLRKVVRDALARTLSNICPIGFPLPSE